ncbi:N-acetyltransferase [Cellvibrio zantedeschiae]|uniref:N-acetyltransferase n=1 Tax=Cellvibrio zantedeschiae TaxID=1237077 RepID=A0ABQ3AXL2_9GAMM|nr:GNAT family N-acetyltransferase [Cellvibrio zantedeschiae]GGY70004.1 N-acetyltransferase [Cellvibrio zantedeschiae]
MSFNIRPMLSSDLRTVEAIQAEAYAGHFLESAHIIAQRFDSSPTTSWVAERDGQVCAYLVAYWSKVGKISPLNAPFAPIEEMQCLYLHDLALLKIAQGFGLARLLINAATDHASNQSAYAIALLSVQSSKAFWQGLGFSEFAHLEESQQENLNTYLTGNNAAFYMLKHL